MSRIGKQPITIPAGVSVSLENDRVKASGPKGSLEQVNLPEVRLTVEDDKIVVTRSSNEPTARAKHGLMRSLVNNMITGVSQGFEKKLEINGVGYRVQMAGSELKFNLGFSHDVMYKIPDGIKVSVEQNIITVSGIDKQQVGQVAAEIRALKKPEPYKGKGIKYVDERIIRKSGKSGKE